MNTDKPLDDEFSYSCKTCGTRMYARRSEVGSKAKCPDCYTEFAIPVPPPAKARSRTLDLSTIPEVALKPLSPSRWRNASLGVRPRLNTCERPPRKPRKKTRNEGMKSMISIQLVGCGEPSLFYAIQRR